MHGVQFVRRTVEVLGDFRITNVSGVTRWLVVVVVVVVVAVVVVVGGGAAASAASAAAAAAAAVLQIEMDFRFCCLICHLFLCILGCISGIQCSFYLLMFAVSVRQSVCLSRMP